MLVMFLTNPLSGAVGSRLLWASPELNPAINHTLKVEFDDSTHGGEAVRMFIGADPNGS